MSVSALSILPKKRLPALAAFSLLCAAAVFSVLGVLTGHARAFTPNYNSSNLIDNPTLIDTSTMSAGAVQAFLSSTGSGLAGYSDVEACDGTDSTLYGHCGQTVSAAQIIYDAGQAYGINPRAILATLEKEQSLVTDPTPTASQINCAMGYHSCSGYAGFFTQVDWGTYTLRYNYEGAMGHSSWLGHNPAANYPCRQADTQTNLYNNGLYAGNTVTFADPGGVAETITLANAATASLYCYTPYVRPYSVTGYSGSYNFVYYYQLWFGATTVSTPYAWAYDGQWAYSDSSRTQPFTATPTVVPGGKIYVTVKARNVGYQTWSQATMHLGTSHPMDRTSAFADGTWLSPSRPAQTVENSVVPGDDGTFEFEMQAPNTPGTYNEYFNLLVEGVTWLNDPGLYFTINVNTALSSSASPIILNAGQSITKGNYKLAPQDSQSALTLQSDGNLVLYSNFQSVWQTGPLSGASQVVMQSDGNLVLYDHNMNPLWNSQTQGNPGAYLVLQTDGNLVIYSASNSPLWATYTTRSEEHLAYVNTTMNTGRMYPGQSLDTPDRRFHLILQGDGNLVLYSPTR